VVATLLGLCAFAFAFALLAVVGLFSALYYISAPLT